MTDFVRTIGAITRRVHKIGLTRNATAALATLIIVSGILGVIRYTGICTLALDQVLAACPLGFFERSLASQSMLPELWLGVGLVVLSVIALGRVFCSWICPAGLVRRLLRVKPRLQPAVATPDAASWSRYSPYAMLAGVLLASFLFRFPVFCFFCPVGLAFATIFAVLKLTSSDPLGVELVIFPVMLGVELVTLRSWCRSFCPLGALLSIFGNLNHLLIPVVKPDKCRASQGIACVACQQACPEGINLTSKRAFRTNSCTKCLECYTRCPVKAIKIAVLS